MHHFFCFSTESTDPDDDTDNTLVKKIVYDKGTDSEYTETFNYDGNKLISVDNGDGWKNVYTYENDNLVKDECFVDDVLQASVTLDYNLDEKIATYTETFTEDSGLGDRKIKHVFTYNNEGTITDEVYISYLNTDFELDRTKIITLNGKNISKIADGTYSTTYTYDDKNGAFKNIHAVEVLNILSENEFGSLIYGNTNNMTSFIENDTNTSDNYNNTYEYTYNDKNYPKIGVYKSVYGGIEDDIENVEFFYE
tara:strand:- start:39725 stop:40480 length:756 start_codon:yes stop_codon:yes gene_type:complete